MMRRKVDKIGDGDAVYKEGFDKFKTRLHSELQRQGAYYAAIPFHYYMNIVLES